MNIKMVIMVSALMLAGTSAFAEDQAALSTVVSYSDLNLTSVTGRAQLNDRIDHAVRAVCPKDRFDRFTVGANRSALFRDCLATARASIGSKVDLAIAQATAHADIHNLEMADAHPLH